MIECISFKSHKNGYLQGFANFYLPKVGIELYGCSLFMKEGKRWINFPSKEYVNQEGEKKYAPYFRFRDQKHWETFCEQAKQAIDKWCTENNQQPEPEVSFGEVDAELPF